MLCSHKTEPLASWPGGMHVHSSTVRISLSFVRPDSFQGLRDALVSLCKRATVSASADTSRRDIEVQCMEHAQMVTDMQLGQHNETFLLFNRILLVFRCA